MSSHPKDCLPVEPIEAHGDARPLTRPPFPRKVVLPSPLKNSQMPHEGPRLGSMGNHSPKPIVEQLSARLQQPTRTFSRPTSIRAREPTVAQSGDRL